MIAEITPRISLIVVKAARKSANIRVSLGVMRGIPVTMKAIVVTDQAAGTAGMTLVERPEPEAAINDVVV